MKKYLLLLITTLSFVVQAQTQADVDIIRNRWIEKQLATTFNSSNVTTWKNSIVVTNGKGRWSDIDYTVTIDKLEAYSPLNHLSRCVEMSLAYAKNVAGNVHYNDPVLLEKIKYALNDNLNRPHDAMFTWNHDWAATYLVAPKYYLYTLLALYGKITTTELNIYLNDIVDGLEVKDGPTTYQFTKQGVNTLWVSNCTVMQGAMQGNINRISNAYLFVIQLVDITPFNVEGIKSDWQWHQHGEQVYCGGYGAWFIPDFMACLEITEGTAFKSIFNKDFDNFANYVLKGKQWMDYRHICDWGSIGRGIAGNGTPNAIWGVYLDRMATLDPTRTTQYMAYKAHRENAAPSAVTGCRHFWKSDLMVLRGGNYHLSAKVMSTRTDGTETMNNENLKGYNLPIGSTNIMTHANEYLGIFRTWDWSRIPGTTTELVTSYPSPHTFRGFNTLGGGVATDSYGALAFASSYQSIYANKAYFFCDDVMFCMGTGINTFKTNNVVTSVNQCISYGNINYNDGSTKTFGTGIAENPNVKWIYHDNVGYVFPSGGKINIKNGSQSGSYFDINNSAGMTTVSDWKTVVSKNVFSIWLNHGTMPINDTYQYIVAPNKTLAQTESFANNHGFQVAQNDPKAQAIKNTKLNLYFVVFYSAGTVKFSDNLEVTADKAAMVMIAAKANNVYEISVADPLYADQNTIKITVNKVLSGTNVVVSNNKSTITVEMPRTYNLTGSTVTNSYQGAPTVLNKNNSGSLKIFPNPTKGIVNFTGLSGEETRLEIVDLNGKQLLKEKVRTNKTLDVGVLKRGTYLMKLTNSTQKFCEKLVID